MVEGSLGGDDRPPGTGVVGGSGGRSERPDGVSSSRSKRLRPRHGKTVGIGGDRKVKYYRFTAHELDFIAEPQRNAARAGALAAFSFGLFINTLASFSFGKPDSDTVAGAWLAIALASLCVACLKSYDWWRYSRAATSRLDQIKDEHAFD